MMAPRQNSKMADVARRSGRYHLPRRSTEHQTWGGPPGAQDKHSIGTIRVHLINCITRNWCYCMLDTPKNEAETLKDPTSDHVRIMSRAFSAKNSTFSSLPPWKIQLRQ